MVMNKKAESKVKNESVSEKQLLIRMSESDHQLLFQKKSQRQLETGKSVSYSELIRQAIRNTYGVSGK